MRNTVRIQHSKSKELQNTIDTLTKSIRRLQLQRTELETKLKKYLQRTCKHSWSIPYYTYRSLDRGTQEYLTRDCKSCGKQQHKVIKD